MLFNQLLKRQRKDSKNTLHSVPESLYSFRFHFSPISVFYNRKFKKNREIAGFIPNPLRFHEKN